MKHGVYKITVEGRDYFEVYVRGEFIEMFIDEKKANIKFQEVTK